MVAQSGRYKPNSQNLRDDFVVEGEQHYWVHVAIDRFTGQVLDKQIESSTNSPGRGLVNGQVDVLGTQLEEVIE